MSAPRVTLVESSAGAVGSFWTEASVAASRCGPCVLVVDALGARRARGEPEGRGTQSEGRGAVALDLSDAPLAGRFASLGESEMRRSPRGTSPSACGKSLVAW